MNTSKNIKRVLGFIFWVILPLFPYLIPSISNKYLEIIFPWGLWVAKLSYDYFEVIQFWTHKVLFLFTSRGTIWEMNAYFGGDFDSDSVGEIYDQVLKIYPSTKTLSSSDDETIIVLPLGITVALRLSLVTHGLLEDAVELQLGIQKNFLSYFTSHKTLDAIVHLVQEVICKPYNITHQKYDFKARFGENNPYFGLFVKRLKLKGSGSTSFNISFKDGDGLLSGRVQVSADHIACTAKDLRSLEYLSKKYITLSALSVSEA
jgi:hypothetical protein